MFIATIRLDSERRNIAKFQKILPKLRNECNARQKKIIAQQDRSAVRYVLQRDESESPSFEV